MVRYAIAACILVAFPLYAFDPAQQDDSLALVRHFTPRSNPVALPTQQGLVLDQTGLTVSLMGGADMFRMQEFGYFEAMLQTAFPDQKLRVRNLGWSGDTVYRQQRPMFFYTEKGDTREGSVPDGREKIDAGVFVLSFGKMESLDGLDRLEEFEAAYDRLIGELQKLTKRIVVVGPVPFAKVGAAANLAEERNEVLYEYSKKISAIARKRELRSVIIMGNSEITLGENEITTDHSSRFSKEAFDKSGLYLSKIGHRIWATKVSYGFGFWIAMEHDEFGCVVSEPLRQAILEKNHLWDQYYRPTNWAFLYGDRQQVPSSRDHKNPEKRWFVDELNRIPALIAKKEKEIWNLAKGGSR